MLQITAVHTVFHKDELFAAMALLYDIGTPLKSRFVSNGLNDTYEVVTDIGKFILRIYKHQWRTESEIRFELDLLAYLKDCSMPVSHPIPRRDGEWLTELKAPEGKRYAALFTYADGEGKVDQGTSQSYGRAVAHLHNAMEPSLISTAAAWAGARMICLYFYGIVSMAKPRAIALRMNAGIPSSKPMRRNAP